VDAFSKIWPRVSHLFEQGDGTYPDIFIEGLSPEQTVAIYQWVMGRCSIYGDPDLWSIEQQQNLPIKEVLDPAKAVVEGRSEGFRHGLLNFHIAGAELCGMTICVESKDCVSFDYVPGADWNEQSVAALFELIGQINRMAPGARIYLADEGCHERPHAVFSDALQEYVEARRSNLSF
jgi:hypothetical protein